ncbi:hypothetical protein [Niabella hirudinis]|uniref:hypothetical protein n=1 Tax=Niabella hirudinis TaxID=1285929 RepID=UPI003EB96AE9
MKELKLEQVRYECETWKRAVLFMIEESVSMKNRLSEILKHHLDKPLLEGVERLQTKLVRNDELIGVFRDDLMYVSNLVQAGTVTPAPSEKQFDIKIDRLQHNLLYLEKHFSKLKSEFNNYLRGNIGAIVGN